MKDILIIFDFYGVLAGELAPIFFKNHFSETDAKTLKDKYFVPADLGKFTFIETINNIAKDYNLNSDEIIAEFKSYVKINYELFDYINKLKENYKVALLSNAAEGIYDLFFPELKLDKIFDKAFLSYKEKLVKPDLNFYKLCISSFNINFDKVIMIDDNINNVNNLDQIDVIGIQYKNNIELIDKLNKILN